MKRFLIMFMIFGLVVGSVATAEAGKKKKKKAPPAPVKVERTVEINYMAPGAGVSSPAASGGVCPFADPTTQECIEIPLQLGEKYIKISITDAAGQKVAGFISQGDTDGDGVGNLYGDFCGAHPEPIALESESAPVRVSFYNGTCADGSTPSFVTQGMITAVFSNLP